MPRPAEPGRTALLTAGTQVAEDKGLRGLSINAVVELAGMAKGTFYHHFSDRRSYVVALHRRYHDELNATVAAATADLPPGMERLRTGVLAYLDACLATRGTKAFLAQSRTDTDLLDEVHARNRSAAAAIEPDLASVGWADPAAVAHLLVAMAAEIALSELYGEGPRPDLRAAALLLIESPPA
ncbi:TetR/AcrR family transcriptional regulator [Nocardia amikacinitolerans]|uniref:TetR/AcrR family transcriptional regulator n=1 Tax=Nocardia amikacinitolerans TaxID=756689 RepID=UPI0020A2D1EA|nr:TetR/AcrR family transcriptional regulator [Nocardia amikacinitolerans]MCP2291067.1 transcriptional regulator, TetR family [Nocardia amikacinitolerans]